MSFLDKLKKMFKQSPNVTPPDADSKAMEMQSPAGAAEEPDKRAAS